MKTVVNIPDLGDADNLEVIEICVKEGDQVNIDDPLIVLESEKAAMEIPSDFQGQIKEVLIKEGDEVSEGMVFATIEVAKEETVKAETEETAKIEQTTTQKNINDVSGKENIFFCGSYCRYGFHEDAVLSAVNVAKKLGCDL